MKESVPDAISYGISALAWAKTNTYHEKFLDDLSFASYKFYEQRNEASIAGLMYP